MSTWRLATSSAQLSLGEVERLAKMSPRRCLLQPLFWFMHVDVLLLLSLFVLPLPQLAHWLVQAEVVTNHGSSAEPGGSATPRFIAYLALLILPLLFWGVWLALRALAEVAVNHSIALLVRRNVDKVLPLVRSDPNRAPDLGQLMPGGTIVPPKLYEPAAPMIQMCENICQQAHEYRFDAATTVVQPYQHFSLMSLAGLEGVQKLALRLGILGAFLGLLFAIRIIPSTLKQMAALRPAVEKQIKDPRSGKASEPTMEAEELRQIDKQQWDLFIGMGTQVFSALSVKFGSSIAGLYVAVGVSLFGSALRRRLRLYFQQMEDTAMHFTLLASRAENKTSLRLDFERLREEMQQLREKVQDKSVEMLSQLKIVSTHLELQIQKVEEGLLRIGIADQGFNTFLSNLGEKQHQFLNEVNRSYQADSLRHELRDIRSGLGSDQQALMRQVIEQISQLKTDLAEIQRTRPVRGSVNSVSGAQGAEIVPSMLTPTFDSEPVAQKRPGLWARLSGLFASRS